MMLLGNLCGREEVRTCRFCGEHASRTPIGDVCARCLESYTREDEMNCYDKAVANGEPVFVLRAQDIMAPAVVDYWVARNMAALGPEHPKIVEALKIGDAMRAWPTRKQAD